MSTKLKLIALASAGLFLGATAVIAAPAADTLQHALAQPAQSGMLILAKHGADDGPNHDVGDDRGRRGKNGGKGRGRGADDGPNHTDRGTGLILAKHGADDGPNHDVGDDRGRRGKNGRKGRGRGADDGPNHT